MEKDNCKKRKSIHQGDIILEPCKIPGDAKFLRKNIIAFGEITGHAHQIEDSLVYEKDGILYARIMVENSMIHNDHPITKPIIKGEYRIRRQEEYFPDGSRQVKD